MDPRDKILLDRRHVLECMVWAGAGLVWTVNGGVPTSTLISDAKAAEGGFSFVQISDSHIGFPSRPIRTPALRSTSPSTKSSPRRPAPPS